MSERKANPAQQQLHAMTVDVEEHFQVSAFGDSVSRESWGRHESRVNGNMARMLDLFDEAGVRTTCFVLGWVAERQPELVKKIVSRGHEIGSHGWSHELIYRQSEGQFKQELERSRKLLQDLSGQPVRGHRAASFSIDQRNLWALDVIAEAGFGYDSSLFPVHHDRYGLPNAPRQIHRLRTPRGHTLIEFPPTTWRLAGQNLPIGGGGYLRLYPAALTHYAVRRLEKERMPVMVYVHPWEVDPEQPRVRAPLKSRFRHYVNLSTTANKLSMLMHQFRFASTQEVIDQHPIPEQEVQL
jgi:polysaccharide deacetylase family protein (PEP-CTERM system associated)